MSWPEAPTEFPIGDGLYATTGIRPASQQALSEAVAAYQQSATACYPRGGGTALDFGGPPARPGVALDLRALDRVVDYPARDMTITVEAGLTVARLGAALAAEGQRLSLDVPEPEQATLGGVFATGSCGPRRFGLGRPRDQILGVRFARGDGQLIAGGGRVVKNVAGYDFPKLLTGSLGTLGILTELTLKVRPLPAASAVVWARLPSLDRVSEALDRLDASSTRPVSIDLIGPAAAGWFEARGLPVSDAAWNLAVGYEGNATEVAWQVDRAASELGVPCEAVRDREASLSWDALTRYPVEPLGRLTLKAVVPPSQLVELLDGLETDRWMTLAHAGTAVVWMLSRPELASETLSDLLPEIDRIRSIVARVGGTLTLPRCPTSWKDRLKVWGEPRPDWFLMARLKQAFDPTNVLNPGRFAVTLSGV